TPESSLSVCAHTGAISADSGRASERGARAFLSSSYSGVVDLRKPFATSDLVVWCDLYGFAVHRLPEVALAGHLDRRPVLMCGALQSRVDIVEVLLLLGG